MDWSTFFGAQLGASAALAGLLFVGISINMAQIIKYTHLANRAFQALVMLVAILIVSSLELVPGQPLALLGAEVLVLGATISVIVAKLNVASMRVVEKEHRSAMLFEAFVGQLAAFFYIVAGVVVLVFGSDGIYLLVPAFLISFVNAIEDAWVLLVEINR